MQQRRLCADWVGFWCRPEGQAECSGILIYHYSSGGGGAPASSMARPCRCVGGALQKPETRRPPLPHQPSIVRVERGLSLVPASVPPTPRRAALRPRRGPQCIARGWLPARAAECRRTERLRRGAAAPRSASAPMPRQELHPRTHCTNLAEISILYKIIRAFTHYL
jgi:hypothetical protein